MSAQGNTSTQSFIVWQDAFSPQELDVIVAYGDRLRLEKADVEYEAGQGPGGEPVRITRTAWIGRDAQTRWIYERLERIARAINEQVYRYDLVGFSEPLQYTVYFGDEGGHFDWHADQIDAAMQRKLSFSLQLSDGDAYQGCDLEIFGGSSRVPIPAPRQRGALIAFPSYVMHRVTPISAGTRKALVFWCAGPRFR